jgi:hypothetical protein
LSRIPKWNQQMVDAEKERIIKLCNCTYLEDLLTCVHIVQLKILSSVRVGSENKKITINIPDFGCFVHQVYINVARKLYSNIFLFEVDIADLETQKRNREMEHLVQTCIMNTIREKIPVEMLLRQYIDETQEVDVKKVETIVETKPLQEEETKEPPPMEETKLESITSSTPPPPISSSSFKEENVSLLEVPSDRPKISFDPTPPQKFEIPARESSLDEVSFDDVDDAPKIKLGEIISLGDEIEDLTSSSPAKVETTSNGLDLDIEDL